jgi:hypothetical protein
VQKQISLRVSANGIRRKCFPWVGRAFSAKASAWSLPATQILFRKLFGFGFYPSGNWNALRISKKVAPSNLEKSSSMQKRERIFWEMTAQLRCRPIPKDCFVQRGMGWESQFVSKTPFAGRFLWFPFAGGFLWFILHRSSQVPAREPDSLR